MRILEFASDLDLFIKTFKYEIIDSQKYRNVLLLRLKLRFFRPSFRLYQMTILNIFKMFLSLMRKSQNEIQSKRIR